MSHDIVDNCLFLLSLLRFRVDIVVQPHDQSLHQATFAVFPHKLGEVAGKPLEEENKAHPLVVGVVLLRGLAARLLKLVFVGHTRMSYFRADLLAKGVGQGECRRDPAKGVNRVVWHPITHNAHDRFAHVLAGGDDDRAGKQQHCSEHIMKPEDGPIDDYFVPFKEIFQPS